MRGTWAALAGVVTLGLWSTSSWQLLPRSRFLDELAQGPMPARGRGPHDRGRARLGRPAADDAASGRERDDRARSGHSSLVVSEEVYRRVVNTLRPPHEHVDHGRDVPPATD